MSVPGIDPLRERHPGAGLTDFSDGLPAIWREGIRAVVCLLDRPSLHHAYEAGGFACHRLALADGAAPTLPEFKDALLFFKEQRLLGNPVVVHCQRGMGRTGALIAGFLISEQGLTPEAATARIRAARPGAIAGFHQREFLEEVYAATRTGAQDGLTRIRPNRSVWVLPCGRIVDVEWEGRNEDNSAYSHGIFVKRWVSFRLDNFFPDNEEVETAMRIRNRAKEIIREQPDLETSRDEDGHPNPYSADIAYNHAAEAEGWVRIKPLTLPKAATIYAETISGGLPPVANDVIHAAAKIHECRVEVLKGGALADRASELCANTKG